MGWWEDLLESFRRDNEQQRQQNSPRATVPIPQSTPTASQIERAALVYCRNIHRSEPVTASQCAIEIADTYMPGLEDSWPANEQLNAIVRSERNRGESNER